MPAKPNTMPTQAFAFFQRFKAIVRTRYPEADFPKATDSGGRFLGQIKWLVAHYGTEALFEMIHVLVLDFPTLYAERRSLIFHIAGSAPHPRWEHVWANHELLHTLIGKGCPSRGWSDYLTDYGQRHSPTGPDQNTGPGNDIRK